MREATAALTAVLVAVLAAALAASPAAAASPDGIWGVVRAGTPDCSGLVIVLRDGAYTKAMLDIGTTQGRRDSVVATSRYDLAGQRLEIAPSFSLSRPEPRQTFVWDRVADALIRQKPTPSLTYRRCPDRPLNPMTR